MNLYKIREQLNKGIPISNLNLRVTYYGRISTDHEDQQTSLSNQEDYFQSIIKNNPNWTYVKGYIDKGISGTTSIKRANFLKMISDSKKDLFDLIITKEISRFSRNTLDSLKYTRELLNNGVAVLFTNDNINTIYSDSELRLTIMSSLAQDEIRRLSERVKFGVNMSIQKGIILGNNKLYGYKKNKNKMTINKKQSTIVRKIFTMYTIENKSIPYICNYLNNQGITTNYNKKWCSSTILRMLKNPKYKGYYCGNKTYTEDYMTKKVKKINPNKWRMYKDYKHIPPIIEESLWNETNNKLLKKTKDNTNYHKQYQYTQKLICTKHNCYLHRRKQLKNSKDTTWICKEHLLGNKCYTNIRESEINKILQNIIEKIDINYSQISQLLSSLYKRKISIPNVNIIPLILDKVLLTKELSTAYLTIFLNIDYSLLNQIENKIFIFDRYDNHNKKYQIKYTLRKIKSKVE